MISEPFSCDSQPPGRNRVPPVGNEQNRHQRGNCNQCSACPVDPGLVVVEVDVLCAFNVTFGLSHRGDRRPVVVFVLSWPQLLQTKNFQPSPTTQPLPRTHFIDPTVSVSVAL